MIDQMCKDAKVYISPGGVFQEKHLEGGMKK